MTTDEQERAFFRIHIPGLIVRYNILPECGKKFFLPRKCQQFIPSLPDGSDLQPVVRIVLEKLDRMEEKIDRLLLWLGGGREGDKVFQFESNIEDIGGGGLSFYTDVPLKKNTCLELCIVSCVGDMPPILAIGRVRWQKPETQSGSKTLLYNVGVAFEDMYDEDQKMLMRMIFQAERKQRRKE